MKAQIVEKDVGGTQQRFLNKKKGKNKLGLESRSDWLN